MGFLQISPPSKLGSSSFCLEQTVWLPSQEPLPTFSYLVKSQFEGVAHPFPMCLRVKFWSVWACQWLLWKGQVPSSVQWNVTRGQWKRASGKGFLAPKRTLPGKSVLLFGWAWYSELWELPCIHEGSQPRARPHSDNGRPEIWRDSGSLIISLSC